MAMDEHAKTGGFEMFSGPQESPSAVQAASTAGHMVAQAERMPFNRLVSFAASRGVDGRARAVSVSTLREPSLRFTAPSAPRNRTPPPRNTEYQLSPHHAPTQTTHAPRTSVRLRSFVVMCCQPNRRVDSCKALLGGADRKVIELELGKRLVTDTATPPVTHGDLTVLAGCGVLKSGTLKLLVTGLLADKEPVLIP